MRVNKFCTLFKHIDARIDLTAHVQTGQTIDLSMQIRHEAREIEITNGDVPSELLRFFQLVAVIAGIDHELLGHTAADHTGPAHAIFLSKRHLRAMPGRDPCGPHTTGAAANHK